MIRVITVICESFGHPVIHVIHVNNKLKSSNMNKLVRSFQVTAFLKRTILSPSEKSLLNRSLSISSTINNISNETTKSQNELVTCDYTHDDKIALVAFNAPDKLNALSVDMGLAFKATIENLSCKKDLRALILTGKGKYMTYE